MQATSYIATPIHTKYDDGFSEFDQDKNWSERAHRLQERRWRKLSNQHVKLDDSIDSSQVRLTDYEFKVRRLAHS